MSQDKLLDLIQMVFYSSLQGVPSGKTLSDVDEEALTKLLGEDDINQILSKTKAAPEWI